jgi:hypothetical protein
MTLKPSKKLSRRDAIKLLGAATGAAMLANLPSKWKTPELASGVLPAHAQTSILHTLLCSPDNLSAPGTNSSSVTISPATSGISMNYLVADPGGVVFPITNPGSVLTDGSGVATLNGIQTGGAGFTVTWSFTNASDGTGNCVQQFVYNTF